MGEGRQKEMAMVIGSLLVKVIRVTSNSAICNVFGYRIQKVR